MFYFIRESNEQNICTVSWWTIQVTEGKKKSNNKNHFIISKCGKVADIVWNNYRALLKDFPIEFIYSRFCSKVVWDKHETKLQKLILTFLLSFSTFQIWNCSLTKDILIEYSIIQDIFLYAGDAGMNYVTQFLLHLSLLSRKEKIDWWFKNAWLRNENFFLQR